MPTNESPLERNRPELAALARGLAAVLLGVQLSSWFFFLPFALRGRADFRQLYIAGFMLRSGARREIYDQRAQKSAQDARVSAELTALPFNHLAYEAAIFAPLSFAPYRQAYFLFLTVNSLLLIFTMRMMLSAFALGKWVVPLCICFLPVSIAMMQGQDSILLLALYSGAYLALRRGNDSLAGALVGLGMFKFQLVLPIAFLFLCWRKWRFITSLAATAAAATIGSVLLVGWSQMVQYARSIIAMSAGLATQAEQMTYGISPAAMPNLRGLVFGLSGGHMGSIGQHTIILIFSVGILLWIANVKPGKGENALALAIATSAIVSYHLLAHDWSVLLVPIAVAATVRKESIRGESSRLLVAACLLFLAPLLLVLGRNYFCLGVIPLFAFLLILTLDCATLQSRSGS